MAAGLLETSIQSLPLVYRGKVRDSYAVGDDKLLIVTTDRLSAFDVVMRQPIPDKGRVLNALSNFWFARLGHVVPNHLTGIDPESVVAPSERDQVRGRAVVARRLQPIAVEAVARGYLIGSGWKDYQKSGAVCGIALPAGLRQAEKLPEPIFTPATRPNSAGTTRTSASRRSRAASAPTRRTHARDHADPVRGGSGLCGHARHHHRRHQVRVRARRRGKLRLMDEVLTADSSRFWPADEYRVGISPPSYDKQFVRDWLETPDWDKSPPPPDLPADVVARTARQVSRSAAAADRQRRSTELAPRLPVRRAALASFAAPQRDRRVAAAPVESTFVLGTAMNSPPRARPLVGVVMGSDSDWNVMQHACDVLKEFTVPFEAQVLSAHRMPDEMFAYAESARTRGLRAIIAGAGGAAHLPGMLASKTVIPVLGVPIPSKYLRGEDSLLSIVQMPRGIPVATFAIGEAGAANAALYAVQMLAADNAELAMQLAQYRATQTEKARNMTLPL